MALCIAWLACLLALLTAFVRGESVPTRLAALGLLLPVGAALVASVMGTVQCLALRYVLGPSALEIRGGSGRLRVRYDQVSGVAGGALDPETRPVSLWPGAHFGCRHTVDGRTVLWRGTTRNPATTVVVAGKHSDWIVTPAAPERFRDALLEQVRAASWATSTGPPPRCGWQDRLVDIDGVLRTMLSVGLIVASLALAGDALRYGTAQRDTLLAIVILSVNASLSLALARWTVGAARLLLIAALVVQLFAVLS